MTTKKTTKSQKREILRHLEAGQRLTALEALLWFGCFRLAARILELRNEGYDIGSEKVVMNGKTVSQYYI